MNYISFVMRIFFKNCVDKKSSQNKLILFFPLKFLKLCSSYGELRQSFLKEIHYKKSSTPFLRVWVFHLQKFLLNPWLNLNNSDNETPFSISPAFIESRIQKSGRDWINHAPIFSICKSVWSGCWRKHEIIKLFRRSNQWKLIVRKFSYAHSPNKFYPLNLPKVSFEASIYEYIVLIRRWQFQIQLLNPIQDLQCTQSISITDF